VHIAGVRIRPEGTARRPDVARSRIHWTQARLSLTHATQRKAHETALPTSSALQHLP
jgi:hypothetical protein